MALSLVFLYVKVKEKNYSNITDQKNQGQGGCGFHFDGALFQNLGLQALKPLVFRSRLLLYLVAFSSFSVQSGQGERLKANLLCALYHGDL